MLIARTGSNDDLKQGFSGLVYKCLHIAAPSYLANELEYTADFKAWRQLRSASSLSLNVRHTWLSTIGDRAFPVAAAPTCYVLALTLYDFSEVASRLSSSDIPSRDFYLNFCSVCTVKVVIFRHFNRSFFLTY